ncbi:PIN domain-containing protein [Methylocapsa sp. S129]|uniref:PIN domain-containing protein n=1 Tax=Methylocapsa sp. S129 TaxID=1641869 RepID=UPI00131D0640|nr:PIN domain-containing protein [Methylocapsa sp. S129]
MKAFFDSNILIYAYSIDRRRHRAIEVIAPGGKISVQVLNEFTNVLRNKQKQDWPIIELAVASIRRQFPEIAALSAETHAAALAIARDHGFSFYDALIAAAALEAGCDTLFSEDMQDGRVIDGLTIRNPFVSAP